MYMYILIAIIIIAMILIFYAYVYNNFQHLIIRLNEAEVNINSALNKKFDLLNRSINVVKGNLKIEREILENIVKLRSRKIDDFELDKELEIAEEEFISIKNEFAELDKVDNFKKIGALLIETKEQLIAAKLYYNDCAIKYNKLIRYFPSNILAFIFKYKEKPFHQNIDSFSKEK
ncbi:MAG: LemA family protein [Bacilli bacterium]|jgi:LemA protein